MSLKIYDLVGRLVSVLVDEVQGAGSRTADWKAGSLSGGICFCRMEAVSTLHPRQSSVQVRKLTLLRLEDPPEGPFILIPFPGVAPA